MKSSYLLIGIILCSCNKDVCIRYSSEGLDYEDVKNVSNLPSYMKFPIDFATKIYISAANTDTADYIAPRFTDTDIPDPSNTTNYIKDITIDVIRWTGGVGPVAQYSILPKKDSTKFSLKAADRYDLVDINTGFRVTDSLITFQVNPMNNNEEIFECFNSYGTMYSQIYQQKTKSSNEKYDYSLVPEVLIWNTWKFKDLRVLGKIINAIYRKAADTTITYYSK